MFLSHAIMAIASVKRWLLLVIEYRKTGGLILISSCSEFTVVASLEPSSKYVFHVESDSFTWS